MSRGFNFPIDLTPKKASIMAWCRRCNNHWKEEITYICGFANSTSYAICSKCVTPEETAKFGFQGENKSEDPTDPV